MRCSKNDAFVVKIGVDRAENEQGFKAEETVDRVTLNRRVGKFFSWVTVASQSGNQSLQTALLVWVAAMVLSNGFTVEKNPSALKLCVCYFKQITQY